MAEVGKDCVDVLYFFCALEELAKLCFSVGVEDVAHNGREIEDSAIDWGGMVVGDGGLLGMANAEERKR